MTNLLIFGASRGLGAAFNAGLPEPGDAVWLVSRSRPELEIDDGAQRQWIQADLSAPEAGDRVAHAMGRQRLDVLLYNAGIWESRAFEPDYDFEKVGEAETARIIAVNLTAPIVCIQKLLPNLRQSGNPKIILIGSTSGLENARAPEVAYTASKFGLRGVAHALREVVRRDRIGVTCINPGDITTYVGGPADRRVSNPNSLPTDDLVAIVRCVMRLSRATCIKEIDLPAMSDVAA